MNRLALHKLMQWLSPAYPVGAFSYSHGLEWVIAAGEVTDAGGLQAWLADILRHGAGRNDAILLAHAYRAKTDGERAEIAELATALTPGAERLLETTAQGAAFARTTSKVWPAALPDTPYPVAIGTAARAHDIPLPETAALYLHAFAANLVSAAVRFVPLGQTEGQTVLANLTATIDATADAALKADLDNIGSCTFRADMASMQHETMTTRIFRS